MLRLSVLLLLASASAKLIKPRYDYLLVEQFNRVEGLDLPVRKGVGESAWVLSLNEGVQNLKLRLVTGDEVREVFGSRGGGSLYLDMENGEYLSGWYITVKSESDSRTKRSIKQPSIGGCPSRHQGRRVKKDDPNKETTNTAPDTKQNVHEKALISEIMRIVNKFALTTNAEPDGYLTQDTDEVYPTLKLYFRGEHTSLVMRAEGRQWHYLIGPPALFPEWFYEEHPASRDSRGMFVAVPKIVQMKFFSVLHHMLTMFLRFPM